MEREPEVVGLASQARRIGDSELAVATLGDAVVTREVLPPGWRWSKDIKPIVGTDLCRAPHQLVVLSGELHVVMEDGAGFDVRAGDMSVIPPGHDAWVVGDEPFDAFDLAPLYAHLIEAGEAYRALTAPSDPTAKRTAAQAARHLRTEARTGRLDAAAVELVLAAAGERPRRHSGPAGLTPREVEVLVLIATGASAKQVAHALGIAPKTAGAHIERIYMKSGVSSRSEATRFAIAHGLVNPVLPGGRSSLPG